MTNQVSSPHTAALNRLKKAKLCKKCVSLTHNLSLVAARKESVSPKSSHLTETHTTRDCAMANESSNIYKPLDPNKNEIRIVRLNPRQYNRDNKQDEQKIICFLGHMILDDAVEYMALSYVWENGFNRQ